MFVILLQWDIEAMPDLTTVTVDRELFLQYLQLQSEAGAQSVKVAVVMQRLLARFPDDRELQDLNELVNRWTDTLVEASETLFLAKRNT